VFKREYISERSVERERERKREYERVIRIAAKKAIL
jgi:hypothetical protein